MSQRSELIEFGWKRSELSGVARSAQPKPPVETPINAGSSLLRASGAIFDTVADDLAGLDLTLLLADRTGRLVHTVGDANGRTRREVQRRDLVAGTDLSEDKVGFNGIGTALEIGRGITIDGDEHFIDAFRNFSCFGVPIVHAGSKRLEGVLNVAAQTASTGSLLEGFGRTLVRQVEQRLLENTYQDEYRLMEAFIRKSRCSSSAVCALGEETTMSNHKADSIFEHIDVTALRTLVRETTENGECHRTVEISRGRAVSLDISTVGPGQSVVTLDPLWQERRSVPRGGPRFDDRGFVWGSLLDQVKGESGVIAVVGDTGTGRTSAALEILRGTSAMHLEGIDIVNRGPEHLVEIMGGLTRSTSSSLLIDDIEVLSARHLGILRRFLNRVDGRRIVLTSTPPGDEDVFVESTLATADRTLTLPPLSQRTAEFGAIVHGIVRQLDATRGTTFSSACLQALSKAAWPANLAQLRKTLAQLVADYPGTIIGLSDLPPQFQQEDSPAMTEMGRAERTVILGALETAGGNKYQAAKALGISRTTLYRRIREYRINA